MKENQSLVAKWLMAIGVLCVLVASTIFATTVWTYFSQEMKFFVLVVITAGCFGGSSVAKKNGKMKITSNAFYYIGLILLILDLVMGKNILVHYGVSIQNRMFWFIVYVVIGAITVFLPRMENFIVLVVFGTFATVVQYMSAWMNHFSFWGYDAEPMTYEPYLLVMIVAGIIFVHRNYYFENKGLEVQLRFTKAFLWKIPEMVVIGLYMHSTSGGWFVTELLLAMECVSISALCKRGGYANKIWISVGLFFFMIAAMLQDLVYIPSEIRVECNCGIAAVCVSLLTLIYGRNNQGVKMFQFVVMCILITLLDCNAYIDGGVMHSLFAGLVSLLLLVVGVVLNKKNVMIASSISIVLMIFVNTIDFWLSIAWWVYLLIAGIILIVLAIKKEREIER